MFYKINIKLIVAKKFLIKPKKEPKEYLKMLTHDLFPKFICRFVAQIIPCQMQSNLKGSLQKNMHEVCQRVSCLLEHINRLRPFTTVMCTDDE